MVKPWFVGNTVCVESVVVVKEAALKSPKSFDGVELKVGLVLKLPTLWVGVC